MSARRHAHDDAHASTITTVTADGMVTRRASRSRENGGDRCSSCSRSPTRRFRPARSATPTASRPGSTAGDDRRCRRRSSASPRTGCASALATGDGVAVGARLSATRLLRRHGRLTALDRQLGGAQARPRGARGLAQDRRGVPDRGAAATSSGSRWSSRLEAMIAGRTLRRPLRASPSALGRRDLGFTEHHGGRAILQSSLLSARRRWPRGSSRSARSTFSASSPRPAALLEAARRGRPNPTTLDHGLAPRRARHRRDAPRAAARRASAFHDPA